MPIFSDFSLGAVLAVIGPLLLLSFVLVPRPWASRHVAQLGPAASAATMIALAGALLSALHLFLKGPTQQHFASWGMVKIGIYFDVLSFVVFLLVSFLGAVVTRYALRYLQGDAEQGYFIKWLCITVGAVLTMVVSGNLLLFTGAWIATSLSLNKLLTFYSHRPSALVAARKKFVISRLGDACLLGAIVLSYRVFGSWEFNDMFAQAQTWRSSGATVSPELMPLCLLLVGGAMLKSAQFPFHSWLPDTMETPTPVSALMHAGIINAGGFLIIRLSPVVSLAPVVLEILAVVGAFTAVFASLVMMTQASIKRMLAFSTIAQMGFMMLQCGLGAFSIAVLHLVAHSLYKAHAFLSSGSVVTTSKSSSLPMGRSHFHPLTLVVALISAVALFGAAAFTFGVSPQNEPSALVLGTVFVMALVHLLWSLWGQSVSPRLLGTGLFLGGGVSFAYFALHRAFQTLLSPSLPHPPMGSTSPGVPVMIVVMVAVVALFGALLVFQSQLSQWTSRSWCQALYVHARNGFYFNTLANRAIQSVWPAR